MAELMGEDVGGREVAADVVGDQQAGLVPGDEVTARAVEGIPRGRRLPPAAGAGPRAGPVVDVALRISGIRGTEVAWHRLCPVLLETAEDLPHELLVLPVLERGAGVVADGCLLAASTAGIGAHVSARHPDPLLRFGSSVADDVAEATAVAVTTARHQGRGDDQPQCQPHDDA